jgi:uncharacterized protein
MAVRVLCAILGLVLSLLAPSVLLAEGDSSVMNWRATQPAAKVSPTKRPQTYRARRRYDTPRLQKADDASLGLHLPDITVAPGATPEAERTKIAVIGDSLAEALVSGLEADPGIQADLVVRHKTVSASGLVRLDYHDWPKTISTLLTEQKDLAALIVMVGVNDRQIIREGEQNLEPLGEAWREAYRKRIDAVIQSAQTARLPLIWVGLPVMRAPKLSADIAKINEMIRERVMAAGETWVETYESFADDTGGFTVSGPDIIGDTVRLRGADGIHFTPAGERKLAFFVDKPLRRRLGDHLKPNTGMPPFSAPQTSTLTPQNPTGDFTIPLPRPATIELPKARPDIGEVQSLINANAATGLIGRQTQPPSDPATRSLFDRGISPAPRSGRSDDYRWK